MSKKRKELKIGIFTVAVLLTAYVGFNFLKNNNIFGNDYIIYATMDKTNGLEVGATLRLKGYKVGTMQKMTYDVNTNKIVAQLAVNGEYKFPVGTTFQAGAISMLGSKAILIQLGQNSNKFIEKGDTILITNENSMIDMVTGNLGQVVEKLTATLDNINKVLADENIDAVKSTLKNIEGATQELQGIVSSQRVNISKIVGNLTTISASLKDMMPELKSGVSDFSSMAKEFKTNAPELIGNAATAIDNLKAILTKVDNGEGTAGKLVNDKELYVNLNQALENLSLLIADLQENPKKYINLTVFGKKDKDK